jgi:hypothetical protein
VTEYGLDDEDSISGKVREFIIHWLSVILSAWTNGLEREAEHSCLS